MRHRRLLVTSTLVGLALVAGLHAQGQGRLEQSAERSDRIRLSARAVTAASDALSECAFDQTATRVATQARPDDVVAAAIGSCLEQYLGLWIATRNVFGRDDEADRTASSLVAETAARLRANLLRRVIEERSRP
jgi:hypothetical protein